MVRARGNVFSRLFPNRCYLHGVFYMNLNLNLRALAAPGSLGVGYYSHPPLIILVLKLDHLRDRIIGVVSTKYCGWVRFQGNRWFTAGSSSMRLGV